LREVLQGWCQCAERARFHLWKKIREAPDSQKSRRDSAHFSGNPAGLICDLRIAGCGFYQRLRGVDFPQLKILLKMLLTKSMDFLLSQTLEE